MPLYACVCTKCDRPLEEFVATVSQRERMRCPDPKCQGKLTNDYSRIKTSNFSLKGSNWPGKQIALEGQIMKNRNAD